MTTQEALQLRDRFYRCETSIEEERLLVGLLLSDDCPEELLADRHAIITLADEKVIADLTAQHRHSHIHHKIAVAIIGLIFMSGLAIAMIHISRSPGVQESRSSDSVFVQQYSFPLEEGQGGAAFTNIRLDSLLSIVAKYYGCTVVYRDEQPRSLRISTTWDQSQPLDAFIALLNELDGLHLTTEGDTIFVNNK